MDPSSTASLRERMASANSAQPTLAKTYGTEALAGAPFGSLAALSIEVESIERGGNGIPGRITGTVVVNEHHDVRRAWVDLLFMEDGNRWQTSRTVASYELPIGDGTMSAGMRLRFTLELPEDAVPAFTTTEGTRSWKIWAQADRRGFDLRAAADPHLPTRARTISVADKLPAIPANAQHLLDGSSGERFAKRQLFMLVVFGTLIFASVAGEYQSGGSVPLSTFLIFGGFLTLVLGVPMMRRRRSRRKGVGALRASELSEEHVALLTPTADGGCSIDVPSSGTWRASLVLFERSVRMVKSGSKTRKRPFLNQTVIQSEQLASGSNPFQTSVPPSSPPTHAGSDFSTWYELRIHDTDATTLIGLGEVTVTD